MPPKTKANRKMKKQPIPEDFELSDDEPKMVNLSKNKNQQVKILYLIVRYVMVNYS